MLKHVFNKPARFGVIRYAISTSIMVGAAPEYYAVWLGWRILSIPLPSWLYQKVDDMLYSTYQRLVLLFFEHGTGLKVRHLIACA